MLSKINNSSYSNITPAPEVSNHCSMKAAQSTSDKHKSHAMTYMIGATALGVVIAAGILSKKGCFGEKIQKLLGKTPKNPATPATNANSINLAEVDKKAKTALGNLYQKVIDKAQTTGNDRRVKIFEQCKNNINSLDTKTTYGNLLEALYKDIRLGDYATSNLITKDIEKITAKSTSSIRVHKYEGWHYRIPNSRQTNKTVDRISVNALADENLIKALDDLFASGKVKGYYKTPNQSINWLERHDPITIYLDEAANKSTLDSVRAVCEKYIRSTDDVLIGDKFASGMALQKSPTKQDIETLLSQAKNIDPQLESVLRTEFTDNKTGKLKTSAGYIEATKRLFDLLK